MKNNTKYIEDVKLLSSCGCGVIFTRTREPFRAVESLKSLAFDHMKVKSGSSTVSGVPFFKWDIVHQWEITQPTDDVDAAPQRQTAPDALAALKWIRDVDGNGSNAHNQGVFVMHAIHPWLCKQQNPGIIELLRHYVRDFAAYPSLRLVIVVPEGESLPDELTHDIPVVDFALPSPDEIDEVLDYIIESGTPDGKSTPEIFDAGDKNRVVASASGLTQMEAELAFSKAIVANKQDGRQWHDIPFDEFNGVVLDAKTEVVKQSEVLELMEPVDMSDVGGLDVVKEWVDVAKECFTSEAIEFGCDAPSGIAAIGPPGTGKTLLGKAIATVLGQPLVKFDVSRCFGSLVGESEKRVRMALTQLEAMGRVTVLFDEVDKSLGGSHQGGGDSGVSKRVLGAILTFMQETDAPIFPIYTANRVDSLPPELLRKGRLDEVFAVMPPNREEREAIFKIHLRKRKQPTDIDLTEAIDASQGYVSSELEAAVKESVKLAFSSDVSLTSEMIKAQLSEMKPISQAFADDFRRMSEWAENNARLASTPSPEIQKPEKAARKRPARKRAMAQ